MNAHQLQIQIIDSTSKLVIFEPAFRSVSQSAYTSCASILPLATLTVLFQNNPTFAMQETGLSGYSPGPELIIISVDPNNKFLKQDWEVELQAIIAHEAHHCARWKGPGYGSTLLDALVSEGLARDFEKKFRNDLLPFYHQALSPAELNTLIKLAEKELFATNYDHKKWFFNSKSSDSAIPKYAGYSLGLELVEAHCKKTGLSSAELWNAGASEFWDSFIP